MSLAEALAVLLLGAASVRADVSLGVTGSVAPEEGAELVVLVSVSNQGRDAASSVVVWGEIGESFDRTTVDRIPAGGVGQARLRLGPPPSRPGVHLIALRLDYVAGGSGAGAGTANSQRAYLLLAFGASPAEAVRLRVPEASLDTSGSLVAEVQSADGAPHRVRLRALAPRGLNANHTVDLSVPATGWATARLPLLRGSVPRPSRHGVVVAATTLDGGAQSVAVATSVVHVGPDPARLPRWRAPLLALALVLLAAAVGVELWLRRKRQSVVGTLRDEA